MSEVSVAAGLVAEVAMGLLALEEHEEAEEAPAVLVLVSLKGKLQLVQERRDTVVPLLLVALQAATVGTVPYTPQCQTAAPGYSPDSSLDFSLVPTLLEELDLKHLCCCLLSVN